MKKETLQRIVEDISAGRLPTHVDFTELRDALAAGWPPDNLSLLYETNCQLKGAIKSADAEARLLANQAARNLKVARNWRRLFFAGCVLDLILIVVIAMS